MIVRNDKGYIQFLDLTYITDQNDSKLKLQKQLERAIK